MPLPPPPHGPPDPSMMMGEHGVGIYGFGQSNILPPGGSPFQYYQEGGGGMSFRGMRGRGRGRGRAMRSKYIYIMYGNTIYMYVRMYVCMYVSMYVCWIYVSLYTLYVYIHMYVGTYMYHLS